MKEMRATISLFLSCFLVLPHDEKASNLFSKKNEKQNKFGSKLWNRTHFFRPSAQGPLHDTLRQMPTVFYKEWDTTKRTQHNVQQQQRHVFPTYIRTDHNPHIEYQFAMFTVHNVQRAAKTQILATAT